MQSLSIPFSFCVCVLNESCWKGNEWSSPRTLGHPGSEMESLALTLSARLAASFYKTKCLFPNESERKGDSAEYKCPYIWKNWHLFFFVFFLINFQRLCSRFNGALGTYSMCIWKPRMPVLCVSQAMHLCPAPHEGTIKQSVRVQQCWEGMPEFLRWYSLKYWQSASLPSWMNFDTSWPFTRRCIIPSYLEDCFKGLFIKTSTSVNEVRQLKDYKICLAFA